MPLAPEYAAMFEELAAGPPAPALSDMSPAEGREMYRAMRPLNPEIPIHNSEDTTVSGPLGTIPIRVYTPAGDGPFGVLVYFHGGGWVIGDLDTCDAACREISTLGDLVVVSVDYRMAPEHVYPAAVNDCYAVVQWASANMDRLTPRARLLRNRRDVRMLAPGISRNHRRAQNEIELGEQQHAVRAHLRGQTR